MQLTLEMTSNFCIVKRMDQEIKNRCIKMFKKARFIEDLGVELKEIDEGLARSELIVEPKHFQQNDFVHAGVLATMADHTAGVAATTCLAIDQSVLTIEFKVNFMRPALGEKITCESRVLRAGKTLAFAESEVFAHSDAKPDEKKLVSKALVTLSVVKDTKLNGS